MKLDRAHSTNTGICVPTAVGGGVSGGFAIAVFGAAPVAAAPIATARIAPALIAGARTAVARSAVALTAAAMFAVTMIAASAILAGPAAAQDCNVGEYLTDDQGNPLCWPPGAVPVCFNSDLDPALDVAGGPGLRWAGFQRAVADWNAALTAVGSTIQLEAMQSPTCWAIAQVDSVCADPGHDDHAVYRYAWLPLAGNDASTGRPDRALTGWVRDPGDPLESSQIPETLLQEILARTLVAGAAGTITAADIGWMTHVPTLVGCPSIPWNFDDALAPGTFPGKFDFYSVMLHELGHFLGLDHLEAGESGVMQESISMNERLEITDEEKECLKKCIADPTRVRTTSWGVIKSTYKSTYKP